MLEATLRACNEAATWVSGVTFEKDVKNNFALREHTYYQIKIRWGLGAQAAQHVMVHSRGVDLLRSSKYRECVSCRSASASRIAAASCRVSL